MGLLLKLSYTQVELEIAFISPKSKNNEMMLCRMLKTLSFKAFKEKQYRKPNLT